MTKPIAKNHELYDFLAKHCEIKTSGVGTNQINNYLFNATDCVLFMAEAYIQGMRKAVGQSEEYIVEAKKRKEISNLILVYNWSAPAPGIDVIQIPETLIASLNQEQAEVFLRNLKRIHKDIEEGKELKTRLEQLFAGNVKISTCYSLDGERRFLIIGKISPSDKRTYAERYAEQVATNVMFDLPKALNARLNLLLPEDSQGKYFVEGRSSFHKKLRYGEDAHTELILSNDGAKLYSELTAESPQMLQEISKILSQAILEPFGISLKYYLGKHPLIKLPGTE